MNGIPVPVVKIIKIGTTCRESSEIPSTFNLQIKSDLGIGGGSTVTLLEAERRILVDTGFDFEWVEDPVNIRSNSRNLCRALRDRGLTPNDVDAVFVTHWHRDHFGNIAIFRKAQYLASKPLVEKFKLDKFSGLDDGQEIGHGIKVVFTPGHTAEHSSIIVDSILRGVNARIAIAGDAVISNSYFQSEHIWQSNADFFSIKEARNSINRLMKMSDLIIPGHGVPFLVR